MTILVYGHSVNVFDINEWMGHICFQVDVDKALILVFALKIFSNGYQCCTKFNRTEDHKYDGNFLIIFNINLKFNNHIRSFSKSPHYHLKIFDLIQPDPVQYLYQSVLLKLCS